MVRLLKHLNLFRIINLFVSKIFVYLVIKIQECRESPLQNSIMKTSAAVTFIGLFTANAYAQTGGFAEMASQAADQGDSMKQSAAKAFGAGGFILAGWGGYNWWRKGKEGENSQIKAGQIIIPIIAGAALGSIGFVMTKGGETVGISSSSNGQLP